MIIKYEKIYEGDDLAGSTLDLMFLRSPGGTIKSVYLYAGADVNDDDAVFNITKNGVALWADEERLTVAADSDAVSKTDLEIETVRGDVLMLALEECPEDGVTAPVTLILEMDDGEEATALASTDDLDEGATNFYFTAARVWATVLTGIVFTTNAAITAADSILIAFGKLQAQITALIASVSTNTANIATNTTAINGKVSGNAAITGATKTKITYDAKGLVTAGADVTATDIGLSDVTNHAQLKRAAADFASFTEKTVPVSADLLLIEDSAASGAKKKVQIGNLPPGGGASLPSQTGNNGKFLTTDATSASWAALPIEICVACSDETTAIAAGTAKVTFRIPKAITLTGVRASVTTAPTGSTIIIDINEAGTSILSTKLSIDAGEKTSVTAASAAVISDTALADDAEITIDFDQIGSTVAGAGVKVWLIGVRA